MMLLYALGCNLSVYHIELVASAEAADAAHRAKSPLRTVALGGGLKGHGVVPVLPADGDGHYGGDSGQCAGGEQAQCGKGDQGGHDGSSRFGWRLVAAAWVMRGARRGGCA
jgi:hypothetical protein